MLTKLLLIQGANLNSLGHRVNPNLYDDITLESLNIRLMAHAQELNYELEIFHTNLEGEAINKIYSSVDEGVDGILANPAGFTYNAYALRDCLKYIKPPYIEIHFTNIDQRGIQSALSEAALGTVQGFGIDSYFIALEAMLRVLSKSGQS